METFKKDKGKSIPYSIDDNVRGRIQSCAGVLKDMQDELPPTSPQHKAIDIILNQLDAYDRNIIIAFYEYDESPTTLGKLLGVSPSVIVARIKRINQTIKKSLV